MDFIVIILVELVYINNYYYLIKGYCKDSDNGKCLFNTIEHCTKCNSDNSECTKCLPPYYLSTNHL